MNNIAYYFNNTDNLSADNADDSVKMKKITDTSSKNKKIETRLTTNSIELADEQNYCKRKIDEEEDTTNILKKVDKKKKLGSVEPTQTLHINQSNESISKINNTIHSKSTYNLLNYFSKITPEQLEQERLKETKVTVKAEIHSPQDLHSCDLLSTTNNKKIFQPEDHVNSKKLMEEYNEICVVQSETLVFSPKNVKLDQCLRESKPKWSLKVQLQSNDIQASDKDDDMYTPKASTQLKENMKNYRNIPKILLPMKNNKAGWNKSLSLMEENEEKDIINLNTNIKTMKTEIQGNKAAKIEQMKINLNLNNKKNNDYGTENEIDNSNCFSVDEKKESNKISTGKLAPLFLKNLRPNPETIQTQRLFLQSEGNKHTYSKKIIEFELMIRKVLPFPTTSHINQITPKIEKITTSNRSDKTYKLSTKKLFKVSLNHSILKIKMKSKNHNLISGEVYKSLKADTDHTLTDLQTYYSDVQSLWKTISNLSKSKNLKPTVAQVKQEKMGTQSNNCSHISYLWTEKYKPNNSHEVIGNDAAVLKLKSWLENWNSLKINEDYSSSEEFYNSDLSNDLNTNQVAVLIGPHGSGKTASVYAVAQELGYMVLEVNASSKRPGKRILKEFEEATKSHRVKNFDLENSFTVLSGNTQKNDESSQNSLILMEDIDLIFEEDDGFVSATFQLASNTKRPIIMTLNNPCLHLPKIAPQQLQINFQPIVGNKVMVLLQLIVLAETGCQLPQSCINALCQAGDLRKSLLQLQYLLLSGKKHILHTSLTISNLSWKNFKTYLYKPAVEVDKIRRKSKFTDHETINNLVKNLDTFTLVSNLMNIDDPIYKSTNVKWEPNNSLIQNSLPYCALLSESLEIGNWISNSIKNTSAHKEKTNQPTDANDSACMPFKEQFILNVNSILSKLAFSSDYQSITLDYLANIRSICRAEEVRNQLNNKRGNRFFHYFQNSRLSNRTRKTSNLFSAACKMLQEKSIFVSKP